MERKMMASRYLRHDVPPERDVVDGYDAQVMFDGETAHVVGSTVRAGKGGPPHHFHQYSDQLYFVLAGEMHVQLGAQKFEVAPQTLVYIPCGTPHHNWNTGEADEFHFEVLSPPAGIRQEILTMTDSTDLGGRRPFIRPLADVEVVQALPGFSVARLLQRSDGSENMALYLGLVEPGSGGPDWHIHRFDQFYYVLDGELTVEVALDKFVAQPGDLVVLPAGVPHRQRNEASERERHLALLLPEPMAGEEWDIAVEFGARTLDAV
jgi:mannose-6-phosphate isomerase-like protein (cupin superfamily)